MHRVEKGVEVKDAGIQFVKALNSLHRSIPVLLHSRRTEMLQRGKQSTAVELDVIVDSTVAQNSTMLAHHDKQNEVLKSSLAKDFVAGGVVATVAKTITAPFERIKLVIQTQDVNPKIVSGQVPRYTGIFNTLTRIASEQGVAAFWRGNLTNCARYFPNQAIGLASKDSFKGLNPWDKETTFRGIASKWAAAQFSVIASSFLPYPFDTVRRRLHMEAEKPINERTYKGAMHCFNKIVKEEGVKALFKGAGANVLRGTGAALVLVLYGEIKDAWK
ncbi:UNVERIFIED_CONTAM: hypothetical protein HDU68_012625 [Siphonaria sp. JEL0065]|nr:hypothetical protein HDU68_012625 [Siphonaria sp. JEL0065]